MNANATTTSRLALFASLGTLICCAVPLLLVTLGFGAAVASLTSTVPWLIPLSERKQWIVLVPGEKPDLDRIRQVITDSGFTPGKAIVRTEEKR